MYEQGLPSAVRRQFLLYAKKQFFFEENVDERPSSTETTVSVRETARQSADFVSDHRRHTIPSGYSRGACRVGQQRYRGDVRVKMSGKKIGE